AEKFGVGHLARRHGELAMPAASHMSCDRDVIGLVGQDLPCRRVAFHQPPQSLRFGGAAADDPVWPQIENVAKAGDSDCASLWRERSFFESVANLVEDNVVDLVECESGDLDWRVGHNQFLKLDLEFVKVPLALLPEAIDGKSQNALFGLAQVVD